MIKAVIDTHGLLNSIPKNGHMRWLYDAFIEERFVWIVSNEIITEYAEIVGHFYNQRTMELVTSILLTAPNTLRFDPYYRWDAVKADPDDRNVGPQ